MCGIAGVVGKAGNDKDLPDILRNLALFMSLRGTDAAGIAGINGSKKTYLMDKAPVDVSVFLNKPCAFRSVIDTSNTFDAVIIHTRAASTGTGTGSYDTSHPFLHGEILGVHNGFIQDRPLDFVSDSDWALSQINKLGAKTALESFSGSYVLVWWNWEKKRLCIARNSGRTLYMAELKSCKKRIFASEAGALVYAAERNNTPLEKLWEIEEGFIYEFDGSDGMLMEKEPFTVKKYQAPVTTTNTGAGTGVVVGKDYVLNYCWVDSKFDHTTATMVSSPNRDRTINKLNFVLNRKGATIPLQATAWGITTFVGENGCVMGCSIALHNEKAVDVIDCYVEVFQEGIRTAEYSIARWLLTQPLDVTVICYGATFNGKAAVHLTYESATRYRTWQENQCKLASPIAA